MRGLPTGLCAAWLLAGLVCALPGIAAGAAEAKAESERWVPALAVFGRALALEAEASPERAPALEAPEDRSGEPAAEAQTERWVPVLAVIVPLLEGEERAVDASASATDLLPGPAVAGAAEAPTPAPAPGEGRPAMGEPKRGDEDKRRIPALALVLVPEAEEVAQRPADPSPPGDDPPAAPPVVAQVEAPTIEPTPTEEQPSPLEPQARDETERWVPAFAVFSGVLMQPVQATVLSEDVITYEQTVRGVRSKKDPGCTPETQPCNPSYQYLLDPTTNDFDNRSLEWSTAGEDLMLSPFVGASAELMTPGLASVPGRPRLFLHGDASVAFAFTRDVAKEEIPGEMVDPNAPLVDELAIDGQGSATTVEMKPLVISAGAGIAFTVDAWERRLRIKPSFEYLQEELEVSGVANRAFQLDTGRNESPLRNGPVGDPNTWEAMKTEFLFFRLAGGKKKTYHGIGPGLEFELDTARAGPFMLTVFISGQAYKMLGERKVTFSDSQAISDPDSTQDPPRVEPEIVTADWSFEKDPWGYRAGVGLRFRWVPE